ncbi:hypothetical protein VB005_07033 [Metarhizium brunneum]
MASTKGPSFSLKSTPFRAQILRLRLEGIPETALIYLNLQGTK